jgi:hypothetical protein
VLLPGGTPAAGAQVGLKVPTQELLVGGELIAGSPYDSVVRTESDGSFSVPMRDKATALYAVNQAGFARVPSWSWTNGVEIMLQPWGRVEGMLRLNNRPAGNEKMRLAEDREGLFADGGFSAVTLTDEQGRFVFSHVPPGHCYLSRCITQRNGWRTTDLMFFEVASGETTNVAYGGKGRPVIGKCAVENTKDLHDAPTVMVEVCTPSPVLQAMAKAANRKARPDVHSFCATAAADGSFQIDDVTPGTYELLFTIRDAEGAPRDRRFLRSPPRQIVVPPLSNPEKCEPFDLGALKTHFSEEHAATAASRQLKAGNVAPTFETKTLGGQRLRLKDFRGKYVLLDLRFMLPRLETEEIMAVNESFGKDDRFVIISLCQTADEDFVKGLAAKGAKHWLQGNLDFEAMRDTYGLNGAQMPLILLIDPKGKIVASGLRGQAIPSAVAAALAKK